MTIPAVPERNFVDQFCHIFDMYSYGNQMYGRLCAHILLGQKLRNMKIYFGSFYIDPRVSLFLIQPSATGKSIPYDYIKAVGTKANVKVGEVDEVTDAALIGTIEPEEMIDPETKTKQIVYNTVKGRLANYDLLHYDEGQMLFRRGQYAPNTLAWFQKALNPIGTGQNLCTKELAHGEPIEFYPTCSLLITSHEIENLMDSVLNTGFFQRLVLFPRFIPINERERIELLRSGRLAKRIFTEIDIDALAENLNAIGGKYQNYELQVDDNVYPVIKQKITEMYKLINSAHERVREIMATFIPRYNNLMYILAIHHMCAEKKDKVDIEDIKYGFGMMYFLFKEAMAWVEENISLVKLTSKEQSYFTSAIMIYKGLEQNKDGYIMKISFLKQCSNKWHISMSTTQKYIERFRNFGRIKEIESNNVQLIKIEI